MINFVLLPMVLILDRLLSEPARFHPLVGFGRLSSSIERYLNRQRKGITAGVLAWSLAVIPITVLAGWFSQQFGSLISGLIFGYLAVGWQSLRMHAQAVADALYEQDIPLAREQVAKLVSRETSSLDEREIRRACIESILENGSDAVIAPLFWLAVAGMPGVVFYRLCNTLDAMWGYRNTRYEKFGKFTAMMDDALNYIPARITALLYVLCGHSRLALRAWRSQASNWYSPNAGVVMASGAGALALRLGGEAVYHGRPKSRPSLGLGSDPDVGDIRRSVKLLDKSVVLLALLATLLAGVTYVFIA